MTTRRVYLDYNATGPLADEVRRAMDEIAALGPLNPSSLHAEGRRARRLLEDARQCIAQLVARADARVVFTSGGTEVNNLALLGAAARRPGQVLVSAVEHPSVLGAAERLRSMGRQVHWIPVDSHGVVRLDALDELLDQSSTTAVVSVMTANNETGVVQPTAEIAARCAKRGVLLHCDAVQSIGKLPWPIESDAESAPLWMLTVSAHKLEGPVGIGALVCHPSVQLEPQLVGGAQQSGWRGGTEPVVLAAGLAATLRRWQDHGQEWLERLRAGQRRFEEGLVKRLPDAVVVGAGAAAGQGGGRLPHTTQVAFPGRDRQALLIALDLAGVACSTGSACSSGSSEESHVLRAMGLPAELRAGALRFSWGPATTMDELDYAVDQLALLCGGPS